LPQGLAGKAEAQLFGDITLSLRSHLPVLGPLDYSCLFSSFYQPPFHVLIDNAGVHAQRHTYHHYHTGNKANHYTNKHLFILTHLIPDISAILAFVKLHIFFINILAFAERTNNFPDIIVGHKLSLAPDRLRPRYRYN
jgi:hypothetical protein